MVPDKILEVGQKGSQTDYLHISPREVRSRQLLSRRLRSAHATGRAGCWSPRHSSPANSSFSFLKGGSFSRCQNRRVEGRSHRGSLIWKSAEGSNQSLICDEKMISTDLRSAGALGNSEPRSCFRFSRFVFGWVSFC